MRSPGVRDVIDELRDRVRTLELRPLESAQAGNEGSGKTDARKPAGERAAYARVQSIGRCGSIQIARQRRLIQTVVADPGFIHPPGIRRKDPASAQHLRARVNFGAPLRLQFRKVFHCPVVVAIEISSADACCAGSRCTSTLPITLSTPTLLGNPCTTLMLWVLLMGNPVPAQVTEAVAPLPDTRATRNQQAGGADRNSVGEQIVDRVRNAAAAVASNAKCNLPRWGAANDIIDGVVTL